ncbi:MAG: MarR family transcriptional regulator [Lentisphaeria bacterium]|nr:MarR family transcriptional regulator [Lentisphaeria bacterium]
MTDQEKVWRELFDIAEKMKSIYSDGRRVSLLYQITLSQLKMVRTVYVLTRDSGEGIPLKEVSRKLGTTAAAASEMVDVLVRKNILERNQDPADRRQVQIRLVPELHGHFCRIEENFTDFTAEFLNTLPSGKRMDFIATLFEFAEFVNASIPERKEK